MPLSQFPTLAMLPKIPSASIDEVVGVMTAIELALPKSDGLWWFNHLYLRVTLGVRAAMTTTSFRDPAFLERLDIVFADLYFDALAAGGGSPMPRRPPGGRCSRRERRRTCTRSSSRLPA